MNTNDTLAGEVERRVARSTRTTVILLDTRRGGDWIASEEEGGRWITFCDVHSEFCQHETRSDARAWMAAPEQWCSRCADFIGNLATACHAHQPSKETDDMPETTNPRPIRNLGEIVGRLLAHVEAIYSDPISRQSGYYGSPMPGIERICAEYGVTFAEVRADVDRRVDAKTSYFLGLDFFGASEER